MAMCEVCLCVCVLVIIKLNEKTCPKQRKENIKMNLQNSLMKFLRAGVMMNFKVIVNFLQI